MTVMRSASFKGRYSVMNACNRIPKIFLKIALAAFLVGGISSARTSFAESDVSEELKAFESIVFNVDKDIRQGYIVRKWVSPIRISFSGDIEDGDMDRYIGSIKMVATSINHEVSYTGYSGNVVVVTYRDVRDLLKNNYNDILKTLLSPDSMVMVVDMLLSRFPQCWYRYLVEDNEIRRGLLFLSSELDVQKSLKCFNLGLAEILGLLSGPQDVTHSVKNKSVTTNYLTRNDIMALTFLYNYNIEIGDSKEEALEKIRYILVRQMLPKDYK